MKKKEFVFQSYAFSLAKIGIILFFAIYFSSNY